LRAHGEGDTPWDRIAEINREYTNGVWQMLGRADLRSGSPLMHLLALLMVVAAIPSAAAPPWLDELLERGIPLTADTSVSFSKPLLRDGMDAAGQVSAIKGLVGDGWDRFVRQSVTSRFEFQIERAAELPEGGGVQRLDLWFIGYGDLDTIVDKKILDNLILRLNGRDDGESAGGEAAASPERTRVLTKNELKARNLEVGGIANGTEVTYALLDVNIVEEVRLRGITRGMYARTSESLTAVACLDELWLHDREFPAQWFPWIRNSEDGRLVLGEPSDYSIAAAYGRATALHEPAGAILVEVHVIFAEPEAWFDGRNLLRRKLPTVLQHAVHSFRRKLRRSPPTD
jgi:hypothetical protein